MEINEQIAFVGIKHKSARVFRPTWIFQTSRIGDKEAAETNGLLDYCLLLSWVGIFPPFVKPLVITNVFPTEQQVLGGNVEVVSVVNL